MAELVYFTNSAST